MNIEKAIQQLENGQPIVVGDKTIEPASHEKIHLETGDMLYLFQDSHDMWLSVDPESEEVILFQTLDEELDSSEEIQVFGGHDYELSMHHEGNIMDDDEELEEIAIYDFESSDKERIRILQYSVSGEVVPMIGRLVPPDALQEV